MHKDILAKSESKKKESEGKGKGDTSIVRVRGSAPPCKAPCHSRPVAPLDDLVIAMIGSSGNVGGAGSNGDGVAGLGVVEIS